jgi:hypothetical protein
MDSDRGYLRNLSCLDGDNRRGGCRHSPVGRRYETLERAPSSSIARMDPNPIPCSTLATTYLRVLNCMRWFYSGPSARTFEG